MSTDEFGEQVYPLMKTLNTLTKRVRVDGGQLNATQCWRLRPIGRAKAHRQLHVRSRVFGVRYSRVLHYITLHF